MKTVCEATLSTDVQLRRVAMESIVKIGTMFYDKLKDYIDALFKITVQAAKTDVEEVALQALEFWSSVAEIEQDINDEADFVRLVIYFLLF